MYPFHTKLILPFALLSLGALSAGCDVNDFDLGQGPGGQQTDPTDPGTTDPSESGTTDPSDPGTTDPTDPGTVTDPGGEVAPRYYAVFIEDRWSGRCATSSVGAHGADIDAVGLWDPNGAGEPMLVGWLDAIDHEFDATACDRYGYDDPDLAVGPPDGSLIEGFYSLAGGWMIGEFDNQAEILPGYEITVHEIDDAHCMGITNCVGSERYDVFVATELDCVNTGADFRDRCMVPITGFDGAEGSSTLPLRGF